jgi:hypothetical protein
MLLVGFVAGGINENIQWNVPSENQELQQMISI